MKVAQYQITLESEILQQLFLGDSKESGVNKLRTNPRFLFEWRAYLYCSISSGNRSNCLRGSRNGGFSKYGA